MTEQNTKLMGIPTTYNDLMGTGVMSDLGLRIFNTVAGASIMGVLLMETEDSFLVGLPSRLMAYGENRLVEPHLPLPLPFMRSMKYTLLTVLPCFGEYELYYIKYLLKEGKVLGPDIVKGIFAEKLTARLDYLQLALEAIAEGEVEVKENTRESEAAEGPDLELDINDSLVMPPSRMKH